MKAVIWKLHGLITPLIIYKVRAVSTVCAVTWFLFRWKEQYAEDLIKRRPHDEVSENYDDVVVVCKVFKSQRLCTVKQRICRSDRLEDAFQH